MLLSTLLQLLSMARWIYVPLVVSCWWSRLWLLLSFCLASLLAGRRDWQSFWSRKVNHRK